MRCKYYFIKERHNPQTGVYFVAMGKIPVKEAAKYESGALYGFNIMHRYPDLAAYNDRIAELRSEGKRVQGD